MDLYDKCENAVWLLQNYTQLFENETAIQPYLALSPEIECYSSVLLEDQIPIIRYRKPGIFTTTTTTTAAPTTINPNATTVETSVQNDPTDDPTSTNSAALPVLIQFHIVLTFLIISIVFIHC